MNQECDSTEALKTVLLVKSQPRLRLPVSLTSIDESWIHRGPTQVDSDFTEVEFPVEIPNGIGLELSSMPRQSVAGISSRMAPNIHDIPVIPASSPESFPVAVRFPWN